ncbi:MAG: primosomal protein N' [Alphaproteobacteria bacterium]|jgi:primosomal protein N' (replication factor Y)|nr:primosomal protein N' [Alphaproteobacteria bacterium]
MTTEDLFTAARSRLVPVLVTAPLDKVFHYHDANASAPAAGTVVEVPFGRQQLAGVVWPGAGDDEAPGARLKTLARRFEVAPLPAEILTLIERVAERTLAPRGAVLKLVLNVPAALEAEPARFGWRRVEPPPPGKLTAARARVLAACAGADVHETGTLAAAAGVSAGVVRGLAEAGWLERAPLAEPALPRPDPARPGPVLAPAQGEAAAALVAAVAARRQEGYLLEGVTGSGKTEVYFEAVAACLRIGRQALVVLPEIALTAQWLARFEERFGAPPVVWHSGLGPAVRRRHWRAALDGRARVVVGARSALFLPLAELGLVVVDEEHDSSFKQDDGVPYHGRDVAELRAELAGCPLVLASATPSLESLARAGVVPPPPTATALRRLVLPERHGGAAPPPIALVDLKRDRPPRGRFLSPTLATALAATVARGEQALVFLNRRGYAPLLICRACGHRERCPNCSAWLVWHRLRGRLLCHHCGYGRPEPAHCPACGAVESLAPAGPGVERIAEEVQALVPEARIAVMTADRPGSTKALQALVEDAAAGRLDVLVGTQVLAKGHHFPRLTLVGVVDADLGLAGGDLRAGERTFQLLHQVAGRAGRGELAGRAVVQTHLPEHPALGAVAAGDVARFRAGEAAERRAAGLPPYGRLAAVILSGPDRDEVRALGRELARGAPRVEGVRVLGPAPAPLALLRGRHRERLLVSATPEVELGAVLRRWLAGVRPRGRLRLFVDPDPESFL